MHSPKTPEAEVPPNISDAPGGSPMVSCLIVEDSEADRLNLRKLLARCPGFELIEEVSSLNEALLRLKETHIDLLFLDIQLGEENGFKLLDHLSPRPQVIVTTAHRQYGTEAYDLDAVDYLVKPISEDRLFRALGRIRQKHPGLSQAQALVYRGGSERRWLPLASIAAVLGDGDYTRVLSGSNMYSDHRRLR